MNIGTISGTTAFYTSGLVDAYDSEIVYDTPDNVDPTADNSYLIDATLWNSLENSILSTEKYICTTVIPSSVSTSPGSGSCIINSLTGKYLRQSYPASYEELIHKVSTFNIDADTASYQLGVNLIHDRDKYIDLNNTVVTIAHNLPMIISGSASGAAGYYNYNTEFVSRLSVTRLIGTKTTTSVVNIVIEPLAIESPPNYAVNTELKTGSYKVTLLASLSR